MRRVHITNVEYNYLFNIGGDGLIAFLATLRAHKENETIKKIGKNAISGTIQNVTGLSRSTIGKHLPILIKIGLVSIHQNGNIAVKSRKWSENNLPKLDRLKLLPIQVHKKFTDTKTCVAFIRVHSNIRNQKRQIGKKAKRIELLSTYSQCKHLTKGEYNLVKKLHRLGVTLRALTNNYRSTCTISNLSFHRILTGTDSTINCNTNSGKNFKKNLIKLGLIAQERIFYMQNPNVRDAEFLKNENEIIGFGGLFQSKDGIIHEVSPIISIIDMYSVGNKKKQV